MGGKNRTLPDLLGLLYEGLLSPDRWNDLLVALCDMFDCQYGALSLHDSANLLPTTMFSVGYSADMSRDWNRYYGSRNPRTPQVVQAVSKTGSWLSTASLDQFPPMLGESEYASWLRKVDMFHSLVAAGRYGPGIAAFGLGRTRSRGPLPPTARKLMRSMLPHFARVLEIQNKNEILRTHYETGKVALDRLDTAVIVVDEPSKILETNQRAEMILEKERGLTRRGGKLSARYTSECCALERLISSAAASTCSGGTIAIHSDEQSAPLFLVVAGLRWSRMSAVARPCALIFISDPTAKPSLRSDFLRTLFSLTPAECRLAALLHEGLELRSAAERMNVTAETARFVLKNIFRKTGSHRQSQLIHLIGQLPGDGRLPR